MNTLFKIFLFLFLPVSCFSLHTIDEKTDKKNIRYVNEILDITEKKISTIYLRLNSFTKKIDEKISHKKSPQFYQDTRIHIKTYYMLRSKNNDKTGSSISLRLDFPLIEKKLSHVFHDNEKKIKSKNKNKYNKINKHTKIKIKGGIKIKSKPYLYLRAKLKKDYSNLWSASFKEELQVSKDGDLSSITSIKFMRKINFFLNINNTNTYTWEDKDNVNEFINALELSQKLNYKNSLRYIISANSDDEQSSLKIKSYDLKLVYKHKIRKWLYLKMEPKVSWQDENNYKDEYSLRFTMGMIIGK